MPARMRQARGFTLIEAAVVLAIMSVVLAVGMPSMANWMLGRKAMGAAVFYQDGFTLARNSAIAHNSHARLVLTENSANGKMDWRVDICYPDSTTRCDAGDGTWSTTTTAVTGNDPSVKGFMSVARSAGAMPGDGDLNLVTGPSGTTEVYFTPLGWVDASVAPHLARIDLAPSASRAKAFAPVSVVLTLAGIAAICDPNAPAHGTRGCPP